MASRPTSCIRISTPTSTQKTTSSRRRRRATSASPSSSRRAPPSPTRPTPAMARPAARASSAARRRATSSGRSPTLASWPRSTSCRCPRPTRRTCRCSKSPSRIPTRRSGPCSTSRMPATTSLPSASSLARSSATPQIRTARAAVHASPSQARPPRRRPCGRRWARATRTAWNGSCFAPPSTCSTTRSSSMRVTARRLCPARCHRSKDVRTAGPVDRLPRGCATGPLVPCATAPLDRCETGRQGLCARDPQDLQDPCADLRPSSSAVPRARDRTLRRRQVASRLGNAWVRRRGTSVPDPAALLVRQVASLEDRRPVDVECRPLAPGAGSRLHIWEGREVPQVLTWAGLVDLPRRTWAAPAARIPHIWAAPVALRTWAVLEAPRRGMAVRRRRTWEAQEVPQDRTALPIWAGLLLRTWAALVAPLRAMVPRPRACVAPRRPASRASSRRHRRRHPSASSLAESPGFPASVRVWDHGLLGCVLCTTTFHLRAASIYCFIEPIPSSPRALVFLTFPLLRLALTTGLRSLLMILSSFRSITVSVSSYCLCSGPCRISAQ